MPQPSPLFGVPIPSGSDAPDGPGAVSAAIIGLETGPLLQGSWTPGYGGDTGATVGANGGSNGFAYAIGRVQRYRGRILFGSSAVAGGGMITGFNLGGTNDPKLSGGGGIYTPSTGNQAEIVLKPSTASAWQILVVRDGHLDAFSSLGNPPSSSELLFWGEAIYS